MGIEPPSLAEGNSSFFGPGGADSGAFTNVSRLIEPDLDPLLAAWPGLSEGTKTAILTLAKAMCR
jgi:hypothetical protein